MGSAVELEDGRRGLVMCHGQTDEGKHRPVVALLLDGPELGERIDLRTHPELDIARVLSGARIGLDLSRIHDEEERTPPPRPAPEPVLEEEQDEDSADELSEDAEDDATDATV